MPEEDKPRGMPGRPEEPLAPTGANEEEEVKAARPPTASTSAG